MYLSQTKYGEEGTAHVDRLAVEVREIAAGIKIHDPDAISLC